MDINIHTERLKGMDFRRIFDVALPFLERLPVVRVIMGVIIMFFLPGFA